MVKKILTVAVAVFLLTGCGGDSKSSDDKTLKEQIAALEDEGKLPKLDRSADIAGPDENQNGIRDDIEAYIIQHYPDELQKKALFQYAKTTRNKLLVDTSDMIAVKKANIEGGKSLHCVFLRFKSRDTSDQNPSIASNKVFAITTNTKARLQAYLKFNHALDGTSWKLPEGDTCE
jgi:hypothetical protein